MKFGIDFFVTADTIGVTELATAVESRGFDSLWLPDHPVLPADPAIRYRHGDGTIPAVYGAMVDPLVALAAASSVTTTLRLATGVCVVPERHPLTLAKAISSLDLLARGRLMFGVGAGWMREACELYGVEFATRWDYLAESVAAMRVLWESGEAQYAGSHVRFPSVRCHPMPVSRPGPPVLVGGPPSPRVLRHVARWADGWFPSMISPAELARGRAELRRLCDMHGRDPSAIEITVMGLDFASRTQEEYRAAGADRLVVQLYNLPDGPIELDRWSAASLDARYAPPPTPSETLRALDRLAASVPAV